MLDGSFPTFTSEFTADSIDVELAAGKPEAALYVFMNSGQRHDRNARHRIAQEFLRKAMVDEAWQTLLLME